MKESYSDEPNDGIPDAPPNYIEATYARSGPSSASPSSASSRPSGDEKRQSSLTPRTISFLHTPLPSSSSSGASTSTWFSDLWRKRTEARTDEEVKKTVLSLIRDAVKDASRPETVSILQSCLQACKARGISFEELAQVKSIEGHTPLYWAIISVRQRVLDRTWTEGHSIIDFLVSFPLTEETKSEARTACMLNSDNVLFQRMRRAPGFERSSYVEEVISAGMERVDIVNVEHVTDDAAGAFRMSVQIADWLRRMRVAQRIPLEFIARGRAWSLAFKVSKNEDFVVQNGQWFVELRLLDGSAPTPVDGRLVVRSTERRQRPDIVLPLQSTTSDTLSISFPVRTKLSAAAEGPSLEYDESPYLLSDRSLRVLGEFRLERPQSDCIIC